MNSIFKHIFDIVFLKEDNKIKLIFIGEDERDKISLCKLEIENNELNDFKIFL